MVNPVNRQKPLFDTGKPYKPLGKWFLAIRWPTGRISLTRHSSLSECYHQLDLAREESSEPLKGSEIFGPRAGAYRVMDGDVWDRKPRARKKRGQ